MQPLFSGGCSPVKTSRNGESDNGLPIDSPLWYNQSMMEYPQWLSKVEELLVEEHNDIYAEALTQLRSGDHDDEVGVASVRGPEEPHLSYDEGEEPEDYVDFIVGEWMDAGLGGSEE